MATRPSSRRAIQPQGAAPPANSRSPRTRPRHDHAEPAADQASGHTAQQLKDALANRDYEIDKRTVERDLVQLSARFPIVCSEDTTPYRCTGCGRQPLSAAAHHRLAAISAPGTRPAARLAARCLSAVPQSTFSPARWRDEDEVLEDFRSGP